MSLELWRESCAESCKVRSLYRCEIQAMETDVLTKGESCVKHKEGTLGPSPEEPHHICSKESALEAEPWVWRGAEKLGGSCIRGTVQRKVFLLKMREFNRKRSTLLSI